jgi:hypothetical protein
MQATLALIIVVVLNVVLIVSNGYMAASLVRGQELQADEYSKALRSINSERAALGAERARLTATVSMLRTGNVKSEDPNGVTEPQRITEKNAIEEDVRGENQDRPDLLEIRVMSSEELLELKQIAELMPHDQSILLSGDAQKLAADAAWNTAGREVDAHTRARLDALLADYRYYYKDARFDTFNKYIQPELLGFREAGAFGVLNEGESAPLIDGVSYTHAELTDIPGQYRLYYFFASDYPVVEHRERVVDERMLEAAVNIFRLLNG